MLLGDTTPSPRCKPRGVQVGVEREGELLLAGGECWLAGHGLE